MASSDTEIASLALQMLGENAIADLNAVTGDRNTVQMKRIYTHALDVILSERPWTFATKRDSLAQHTSTPAFEWAYQYELPSDCVHVLEVNGHSTHLYAQETFAVEDGFILSDAATAEVRYVYRNTDVSSYPPDFTDAFVHFLAYRAALVIQGNQKRANDLYALYQRALTRAGMNNGNESRRHRTAGYLHSDFVQRRHGW